MMYPLVLIVCAIVVAATEETEEACALQVVSKRKSAECYQGAHVPCPGSGNMCAGDQCCPATEAYPYTFPCPSASSSMVGCENDTKVEDCLPKPQPCHTSEFGSILAQKAELTVCEERANEGTLTISGPSVAKTRILANRPVRFSRSVETASFVKQFKRNFATGGAPNAVLAGVSATGELREVTIVLESAEYLCSPESSPSVSMKWKSDDEQIDQNLELVSANLIIDSFWCETECIVEHPEEYVEYKACNILVGELGAEASSEACDALVAAACTAIDAEDGEILDPICIWAARDVCLKVVDALTKEVANEIFTKKTLTVAQFCKNEGYGYPCSCS